MWLFLLCTGLCVKNSICTIALILSAYATLCPRYSYILKWWTRHQAPRGSVTRHRHKDRGAIIWTLDPLHWILLNVRREAQEPWGSTRDCPVSFGGCLSGITAHSRTLPLAGGFLLSWSKLSKEFLILFWWRLCDDWGCQMKKGEHLLIFSSRVWFFFFL